MKSSDNIKPQKIKVLFVCLGNICRSPTGEAVLKKIVKAKGHADRFHIESAGTGNYHIGERPDPRTLHHGEKRGLQFESLAQQFKSELHFDSFDYIVCMDESNYKNVLQTTSHPNHRKKIFTMMSFAPDLEYSIVPDPYHGTAKDFELVIDLLEAACLKFYEKILSEHQL